MNSCEKKESEAYVYAINRAREVEVGPEVGKDFTQRIAKQRKSFFAVISKQLKIRKNLIKLRIDYFKSHAY